MQESMQSIILIIEVVRSYINRILKIVFSIQVLSYSYFHKLQEVILKNTIHALHTGTWEAVILVLDCKNQ